MRVGSGNDSSQDVDMHIWAMGGGGAIRDTDLLVSGCLVQALASERCPQKKGTSA